MVEQLSTPSYRANSSGSLSSHHQHSDLVLLVADEYWMATTCRSEERQ